MNFSKKRITPDQIRARRRSQKLTQQELAELLGKGIRTVQSWEQGLRRPAGEAFFAWWHAPEPNERPEPCTNSSKTSKKKEPDAPGVHIQSFKLPAG